MPSSQFGECKTRKESAESHPINKLKRPLHVSVLSNYFHAWISYVLIESSCATDLANFISEFRYSISIDEMTKWRIPFSRARLEPFNRAWNNRIDVDLIDDWQFSVFLSTAGTLFDFTWHVILWHNFISSRSSYLLLCRREKWKRHRTENDESMRFSRPSNSPTKQ